MCRMTTYRDIVMLVSVWLQLSPLHTEQTASHIALTVPSQQDHLLDRT